MTYWGQLVFSGIADSFLFRFALERGTNLPFFGICFSVPPDNRLLRSIFPHFPDRMLATPANQFAFTKQKKKLVKSNSRKTSPGFSGFPRMTRVVSICWPSKVLQDGPSVLLTNSHHKALLHGLCKSIAVHCRVFGKDAVDSYVAADL